MHDVLAYIGRFQPFHNGHKAVIDQALQQAHRVVIVLGSYLQPRTPKNPWTAKEREEMIRTVYQDDPRITFVAVHDYMYNFEKWLAAVDAAVTNSAMRVWKADSYKIGLIGFDKDWSSFYLHYFPQWENVRFQPEKLINATDIRKDYFETGMLPESIAAPETCEWLEKFKEREEYKFLQAEHRFIQGYKDLWKDAPFPPTFNTADAVVVCNGHALMIRRGQAPGKGLIAFPGGFLGANESIEDCALRELKEETSIDVSINELRGSIVTRRTFDDPQRSQRGRTITVAHLIRLNRKKLPDIKAGDDAAKVYWIPVGKIRRQDVFEDHYDILQNMVSF